MLAMKAERALVWDAVTEFYGLSRLRYRRAQAQQMADRVDEVGAVHRVEMEIGDAAVDQIEHLLGRNRRGDQLARRRIVIEAVETLRKPRGHRRAAALGECGRRLEALHR